MKPVEWTPFQGGTTMQVTSVTDVKELIRYRRAGVSQRAAAEALGLSRNTVANYERELAKRGWLDGSL